MSSNISTIEPDPPKQNDTATAVLNEILKHVSPEEKTLGMFALLAASVSMSCMYMPLRNKPFRNGLFAQWVESSMLFVLGFFINGFRGFQALNPIAAIGGALFAFGNLLIYPVLSDNGYGVWALTGTLQLVIGWCLARFGVGDILPKSPVSSPGLNIAGVVLMIIASLLFGVVKYKKSGMAKRIRKAEDGTTMGGTTMGGTTMGGTTMGGTTMGDGTTCGDGTTADGTTAGGTTAGGTTAGDETGTEVTGTTGTTATGATTTGGGKKKKNKKKKKKKGKKGKKTEADKSERDEGGRSVKSKSSRASMSKSSMASTSRSQMSMSSKSQPRKSGGKDLKSAKSSRSSRNTRTSRTSMSRTSKTSMSGASKSRKDAGGRRKKRKHHKKKAAGGGRMLAKAPIGTIMAMAGLMGVFHGLMIAPFDKARAPFAKELGLYGALNFCFSFNTTAFAVSSIFFFGYTAIFRGGAHLPTETMRPAICHGVMLAFGLMMWFVAADHLTQTVVHPILSVAPFIIGGLVDYFVFRLISDKYSLLALGGSAVAAIGGAALLIISH